MNTFTKLFTKEQHEKLFEVKEFQKPEDIHTYAFSVIWEQGPALALFQLQGTVGNNTKPEDIITTTKTDSDGEISVQIGKFVPGSVINLWWGIRAIEAVSRCSVWITNLNTKKAIKLKPSNPDLHQPIPVNTNWIDSQNKITLF